MAELANLVGTLVLTGDTPAAFRSSTIGSGRLPLDDDWFRGRLPLDDDRFREGCPWTSRCG